MQRVPLAACSHVLTLSRSDSLICLCSVPGHDGGCYGLAFNRTGELLASGGADKCVKLWDPFTAAPKATLRVSVRHLCFGGWMVAASAAAAWSVALPSVHAPMQ